MKSMNTRPGPLPPGLNQNQSSLARFGAELWNSIRDELRQLPQESF